MEYALSPEHVNRVSVLAARGRFTRVRNPTDDGWLIGRPGGVCEVKFDPDLADGKFTYIPFSANFGLWTGDLRFKRYFGAEFVTWRGGDVTTLSALAIPKGDFRISGKAFAEAAAPTSTTRVIALEKGQKTSTELLPGTRVFGITMVTKAHSDLGEFRHCAHVADAIGEAFTIEGSSGRVATADFSVAQIVRQMVRNPFDGENREAYLKAKTIELLCLLRHAVDSKSRGDKIAVVGEASQRLDRMISGPMNLDDLARKVHVSKRTLIRTFKAETGLTLGEYRRSKRLALAAELLANTKLSITQIAVRVGFCETSSFCRAFQKHFSCSPSIFRRGNLL